MPRYSGYDLDKIKSELGQKEWEAVLRPFQHVRMATQPQIEFATGLSYKAVARTLKTLCAVEDVVQDPPGPPTPGNEPGPEASEAAPPPKRVRRVLTTAPRRMAYRAYHTKPATVYLLGQVGAALLREMGLLHDLRGSEVKESVAQAHRLCLLDIILLGLAQGQTVLLPEKELPNSEGQILRADVALPAFEGGRVTEWRMVAVEQMADEYTARRVEQQVERWWSFFAAAPAAERLSPTILMVFNLKQNDLPAALTEWQGALATGTAKFGEAPFEVHYTLLVDYLQEPAWQAAEWKRYPRLLPDLKPVELRLDPLDRWPAQADFKGLFERVVALHALARGDGSSLQGEYGLPTAAVRMLRDWLNTPAMDTVRRDLGAALAKLQTRSGGLSPVVILTKMAWDIVLRAYGVERSHLGLRSEFQVAFVPPEPPVQGRNNSGYGDYHARVSLDSRFFDRLREAGLVPDGASPESVAVALEWMLTALYVYAHELGLRSEPWLAARPARGKKNQTQK